MATGKLDKLERHGDVFAVDSLSLGTKVDIYRLFTNAKIAAVFTAQVPFLPDSIEKRAYCLEWNSEAMLGENLCNQIFRSKRVDGPAIEGIEDDRHIQIKLVDVGIIVGLQECNGS